MMCDGFLQYSVNKRLRVSIWQVAFFHRFLQVIIGAYILIELYVNDHWAFAEQPNAAYNMYVSAGKSNDVINAAADLDATFKYCNNASYSYAYSPEYRCASTLQCPLPRNTKSLTRRLLSLCVFSGTATRLNAAS